MGSLKQSKSNGGLVASDVNLSLHRKASMFGLIIQISDCQYRGVGAGHRALNSVWNRSQV